MVLIVIIALAASAAADALSAGEDTVIKSGVAWFDTDGRRIYAGGGGFYHEAGTWYWVGESEKVYSDLSQGIAMYSSPDLGNWTNHGLILKNTSMWHAGFTGPWRIERPKLMYNQPTKKYVLWWHFDTESFTMRCTGVATADTVLGPYTFVAGFQPDGQPSLDMGTFVDQNGNAYLVRSVDNNYAGISQLTPDYLNTTGITSAGPRMEGQAIFSYEDTYYLLGSHLTGWAPNPAILAVAPHGAPLKNAKWTVQGNPSNNPTTFDSQSTFVIPYVHTDGHTTYIFAGDRWNADGPGGLQNSTYIWLPLKVDSNGVWSMQWFDSWRIGDF